VNVLITDLASAERLLAESPVVESGTVGGRTRAPGRTVKAR
jgi:hypothetical protein